MLACAVSCRAVQKAGVGRHWQSSAARPSERSGERIAPAAREGAPIAALPSFLRGRLPYAGGNTSSGDSKIVRLREGDVKGQIRAETSAFSIAVMAMVGLLATPVEAQEAPEGTPPSDSVTQPAAAPEGSPGTEAGDIIVTAQRRSESINKVPLSIQAFSGEKLASAGVVDAAGLTQVTSGLNFARSSANTPIYTLRGIGFNTPNLSSTSPVGLYVDEVAYAYPYMGNGPLFDVERVEVLKGPQGTLYGRNTTGGLINFIAAKPGNKLEGGLTAELGNYQTYNFEGFVSAPLTETLGLRISGRWENSDEGWQVSRSRGDRRGEKDRLGLRAILEFEPTSALSVQLSASYWRDKSDTVATQAVALAADQPAFLVPGLANAIHSQWEGNQADWDAPQAGKPPFKTNSRFVGLAARVKYDLTDALSIVSLTGYNDVKRDDFNDLDGTPFETLAYRSIGRIKSFSQELRIVGQADWGNYTVGGYYSRDDIEDGQQGYFGESSTLRLLRSVASRINDPRYTASQKAEGFRNFQTTTDQVSRSMSLFANGQVELADRLKLSGGLRYTDDKLSYSACSRDLNGNTAPVWNTGVAAVIAGRLGRAFTPGAVVTNGCLTYNAAFTGIASYEKPTLNANNLAGRVALDFQITPDALLYASASRGYKSGAAPIIAGNVETQFAPATQERVTAYEAGAKLRLADGLARLNVAGFYMDYKDKQLFGEVPDPVFTTLTRIVNIPKSQVYGGEVELTVTPSKGLTLTSGASYTHTKVQEYAGFDRAGRPTDFAGLAFPYTPKWQVNGSASFDNPISSTLGLQASLTASHQSGTSGALGAEAGFEIKQYTLVNASITLMELNGGFRIGVWGRNLFNEKYWTAADTVVDTVFRVPGMVRTYGLTLGYRF